MALQGPSIGSVTSLVMPPADVLVQGDSTSLQRRQNAAIGGRLGILVSVLLWVVASLVDGHVPKLDSRNWPFVVAGVLVIVSVIVLAWSRYFVRAARTAVRYEYTVEPFRRIGGSQVLRFDWMHHDVSSLLSRRIRRLRVHAGGPDGPNGSAGMSHIHIGGRYGIRQDSDGQFIEVTPLIRIGDGPGPGRLGIPVRVRLDADGGEGGARTSGPIELSTELYDRLREQVYFAVASQIYAQIREDVKAKIHLLPNRTLRAIAYLREAEDYVTLNTLDSYEGGIELFELAMRSFDRRRLDLPSSRLPRLIAVVFRGLEDLRDRIRHVMAHAIPGLDRREVLTARAEYGYATAMISHALLASASSVTVPVLFRAREPGESALARLTAVSPDVPGRNDALFDAHVTASLMSLMMQDVEGAEANLNRARQLRPADADADARFLFAAGACEPRTVQSLRLFRRAAHLDGEFAIARFHLARCLETVWRGRERLEESSVPIVYDGWHRVLRLHPAATIAWSSLGYAHWLLAGSGREPEDAARRREAETILQLGRSYREARRDTEGGAIDHGLARIAAEDGAFPKSYRHYLATVSARIVARTVREDVDDYFYAQIGQPTLRRYDLYLERVSRRCAEQSSSRPDEERVRKSVLAFAFNDHGLAYLYYAYRCGELWALDRAAASFQAAIDLNKSYPEPHYNLARAQQWLAQVHTDPDRFDDAARCLKEALRIEPDWHAARILMIDLVIAKAQALKRVQDSKPAAPQDSDFDGALGHGELHQLRPQPRGQFDPPRHLSDWKAEYGQLLDDAARQALKLLPQRGLRVPRERRRIIHRSAPERIVQSDLAESIRALLCPGATDWLTEFDLQHIDALWRCATLLQMRSGPDELRLAEALIATIRRHFYPNGGPAIDTRRDVIRDLLELQRNQIPPPQPLLRRSLARLLRRQIRADLGYLSDGAEDPRIAIQRMRWRRLVTFVAAEELKTTRLELERRQTQRSLRSVLEYAVHTDPGHDNILRWISGALEAELGELRDMLERGQSHQLGGVGPAPSTTAEDIERVTSQLRDVYEGAVNAPLISSATLLWVGERLEAEDPENAKLAFERASAAEDRLAPQAAFLLGELHRRQGSATSAELAYQRAIDALAMVGTDGHHVCDPEDGFLLGQQLEESEQMSHAADAYAFTIKRGGRYASDAALRLAHLVITRQAPGYSEERRSIVAARYYSIARQSTDPRTRAVANAGLMMLYDHDAYRPAVERLFNSSLLDPPEYVLALADACEEQASDHGERDAELWSSRAEQAYRTVASGSSDTAGWAAWRLGRMLQRQGNISGARQWLQQAAERDTGEAAADAALLLAQIEPDRWLNEAERRLNSVAQTGVTVPAESWLTLGDLQRDAKQPNKAFQAYRRAFKSSEMSVQVEAARRNAEVVRAAVHERLPEGEQLFDETLSMGALAAVCVGDALADEYPEKAEKAYRSGAARTTDIWSPDAQLRLGGIIGRRMADGDRDAAAEAEFHLRAAIYSGDMSVVPTAQVWLGDLMYLTGRLSSAERSYVQAMNGPDAAQRSIAAARVGRLFAEQERYTDAVAAYGAAMEGEDQWTVEAAQEMLNMTGRAPDLLWMVTEQLDRLARTGNRAALILGQQLMQEGEMELAERIFRIAAESTGVWAPDAARELGDLLVAQGRHEEGWDFLTRAATSDDFTVAPDAQQRLVTLLRDAIGRGGEEANAARALAERTGGAILHQVEAELGPPDQDGAVAVAPIDGAGPEESGGIGHDPADADRALG